jgi:hypothetical protein
MQLHASRVVAVIFPDETHTEVLIGRQTFDTFAVQNVPSGRLKQTSRS